MESSSSEEEDLSAELELISKLRLAFGATLQMLEAVRDNLVIMGERMDRLQESSRKCREHYYLMQQKEESQE